MFELAQMPDKDLDSTIAQDKKNPVELQGYVWFEIMDPTRIDDDPGMSFLGGCFE